MLVITASFEAQEGKEAEVEQAFRGMFPLVRDEAGLITYILHRAAHNPRRFFFYEQYKDKEAFDYHSSTPHFQALFGKIKTLVAGEPVVEFFEELESIKR